MTEEPSAKRQKTNNAPKTPPPTKEIPWDGSNIEQLSIEQLSSAIREIQEICELALTLISDLPDSIRQALEQVVAIKDPTEVIIAILGESGSGKSTLFNSILRRLGILPQGNSGQACTAAPIEIRCARDPDIIVDIEVQYIDTEEFRADIVAAQRAMKSLSTDKEHAMSQVSKLEAVFPEMSRDDLEICSPDELLIHDNVRKVLGTSESHKGHDREKARAFLRKRIVATKQSKDRSSAKWPLVKVAKVYIRSSFLEDSKIVLTDVPGFNDSNKFRSARSRKYINGSAATCIITPASRGGTDASLSALITESLQDMLFGARFDKAILVSTKSDAVSTEELEQDRDDDEREASKAREEELIEQVESVQDVVNTTRKKLHDTQAWERAYRNDVLRWKKVDKVLSSGIDAQIPRERTGNTSKFEEPEPDEKSVKHKKREVKARIVELKESHAKSERRCDKLGDRMKVNVRKLSIVMAEMEAFVKLKNEGLIADRNATLKELQLDMYLDAIRDIDMEMREAAEDNPDPNRPELPTRNYAEIRRQLPVFCTTARSYQNQKGYTKDTPQHDFCKNVEETGIPELRAYLAKIGKETQITQLRSTFRNALEALNDLSLVVKTDLKPQPINPEEAKHVDRAVNDALAGFGSDLTELFQALTVEVQRKYSKGFVDNIRSIKESIETIAEKDMAKWVRPAKQGGYCWGEYKATLNGQGEHTSRGPQGMISFNDKFRQMIQKGALPFTEAVFIDPQKSLKTVVNAKTKDIAEICQAFHAQNRQRMMVTGVSHQALRKLDDQLKLRTTKLYDTATQYKNFLSQVHSTTAAELSGKIQNALKKSYAEALEAIPEAKMTKTQAMNKSLRENATKPQTLAMPLRSWEKKMNQGILRENDNLNTFARRFIDGWSESYRQALLNRSDKIDLSDNPGKDEIRNRIIATRLIDDEKLGLSPEKPLHVIKIEEEEGDDLELVPEEDDEEEQEIKHDVDERRTRGKKRAHAELEITDDEADSADEDE